MQNPVNVTIDLSQPLSVTATLLRDHAAKLQAFADQIDTEDKKVDAEVEEKEEVSHIDVGALKTKKTRAKKTATPVAPIADEELDLGDEEEEESEEEKPTLEGHIIPAFQAFAKKHSREKAGAILGKYKVKSVRDLPETEFSKILSLLGA